MKKSYLLLKELGYLDVDIERILNSFVISRMNEEKLYNNIIDDYNFLSKYYTKEEIKKMVILSPTLFGFSTLNLEKKIDDLIKLGYTKNQVIKMCRMYPYLFGYNIITIKAKLDHFVGLGYSYCEILKLTYKNPSLITMSSESFNNKINFFISLGYTKEEIIHMSLKFPRLLSLSSTHLLNTFKFLKSIGYSEDNIRKMTCIFPPIYGLSTKLILNTFKFLKGLGYTYNQVIDITISLPAIFSYSDKNLLDKIRYYKEIGLSDLIIIKPKILMQSIELSYARYEYMKTKNIVINIKNYRKLFIGQFIFVSYYDINNDDIKILYPIGSYLDNLGNKYILKTLYQLDPNFSCNDSVKSITYKKR